MRMSTEFSAEPASHRPKSRIGEANIEKILDASLGVFASFGLRGARLDQIADACGMSKPNLLYYFPSKEALYLAVLTRTLTMWFEPLRGIDPDAEPRATLTAYIEAKLASSRDYPEASRLFAIEVISGAPMLERAIRSDLAALVSEKVAVLNGWIAHGRLAPIDPLHFLFAAWATTQTYADFAVQIRALAGGDLSDPAFFTASRDAVVALLLDGALPRG
jgi:TetR/AcrR family transcriptional regulator